MPIHSTQSSTHFMISETANYWAGSIYELLMKVAETRYGQWTGLARASEFEFDL